MSIPISVAGILLLNILSAFSIAGTNGNGFDMDTYASGAAYGFLIILALFFIFFIYYSLIEVKQKVNIRPEKTVIAASGTLTGEILAPLNLIYYSIITLIILYIITFVLLIF